MLTQQNVELNLPRDTIHVSRETASAVNGRTNEQKWSLHVHNLVTK